MREKTIIFGAGRFFESNVSTIEDKYEILAIADNNDLLHGKCKCGRLIISPEEIKNYDYDNVLICMSKPREVQQQLTEMGIETINLFVSPGLIYSYGANDIAREIREKVYPYEKTDVGMHILFAQINPCTRTHKFAELLRKRGIKCSLAYFGTYSRQMEKALTYYENVNHFFSYTDFVYYVRNSDYDLVHCSNEPDILVSLLSGCGRPIVHDCHDFLSLRDDINPEKMALEIIANTKSDGFIYASKYCMNIAAERYNIDTERAISIENRPSTDALPQKKLTKLSTMDGELHCVYEGGISNLPSHFRYFEKQWMMLASVGIHVHFYTSFNEEYCNYLDSLSEFIHYEGNVDIYELLEKMTQYDIGLCTFGEQPNYKLKLDTTSSNKIYEYLAAGLPVAASNHMFHRNIIEEYSVGKIINWKEDVLKQFIDISFISIGNNFIKDSKLTMEDQADEIIGFYKRTIAHFN